jgi:hypothetical protein
VPSETPTLEPTATLTPTLEPTATLTPTLEPTVVVTPTPTFTATVEITATATTTPTMGAQGEIGVKGWNNPYTGSWTTEVSVQNMGASPTDINIDWYLNNAASSCGQTTDTNLAPGAARFYQPPTGACGTSWMGSAVVSGNQPLAAVAESKGSIANLLSDYLGGSEPTTEPLIFPQLNVNDYDPLLIGVSNAGSAAANVNITLWNRDGTFNSDIDTVIQPQSAVQLNARNDIVIPDGQTTWNGIIRITNTGAPQPLYAVVKTERASWGTYPISLAIEGYRETSDASTDWFVSAFSRKTASQFSIIPTGTNVTLYYTNPSTTLTATVTVRFYTGATGVEVPGSMFTESVPPRQTGGIISCNYTPLPSSWGGTARITSDIPLVARVDRWWNSAGYYGIWAAFRPDKDPSTAGTATLYYPALRKRSSGNTPIGDGWNTIFYVANLGSSAATVKVEIIRGSDGFVAYNQNSTIAASGRNAWNMLSSAFDAALGTTFNGGIRFTVVDPPSGGRIVGMAEQTINYTVTTDGFGIFNGVNQ